MHKSLRRICSILCVSICLLAIVDFRTAEAKGQNDADRFALGNAVWVLFHEVGHLLIHEFGLHVLGREEDAADHLATLALLEIGKEKTEGFLFSAVDWFFFSANLEVTARADRRYYSAHGLDEQRAFEVACLMLGSNPAKYEPLADEIGLPAEERIRCPETYSLARSSWFGALDPHLRSDGKLGGVEIELDPPGDEFEHAAELLRHANTLQKTANFLTARFSFDRPITLRARKCGEANAYYDGSDASVVLCYELVNEFLSTN